LPVAKYHLPLTHSQAGRQSPCAAAATVPSLPPLPRVCCLAGQGWILGWRWWRLALPSASTGRGAVASLPSLRSLPISEVFAGCSGSPLRSQTLAARTFPASSPLPCFPAFLWRLLRRGWLGRLASKTALKRKDCAAE